MQFRSFIVATMCAVVSIPAATAESQQDRHFFSEAIKGDNSEITLGNLAERRGDSQEVRQFGAMLTRDHTQARAEAIQVARRLGISPPTSVMTQARRERARLMYLRGPAFDREFVHYMVKDHREDIDKFEKQARETGDASRLAQQTLPTLRKHLQTAEDLERGLKGHRS